MCLSTISRYGWVWQNTHTVTTTSIFKDLGELLAEILDDVSMVTMPLRYG